MSPGNAQNMRLFFISGNISSNSYNSTYNFSRYLLSWQAFIYTSNIGVIKKCQLNRISGNSLCIWSWLPFSRSYTGSIDYTGSIPRVYTGYKYYMINTQLVSKTDPHFSVAQFFLKKSLIDREKNHSQKSQNVFDQILKPGHFLFVLIKCS